MTLSEQNRNSNYYEAIDNGSVETGKEKVLRIYREAKENGLTRREVENYGVRTNIVTGRTKELLDEKKLKETGLTRGGGVVIVAKEYYDYQIHNPIKNPIQLNLIK